MKKYISVFLCLFLMVFPIQIFGAEDVSVSADMAAADSVSDTVIVPGMDFYEEKEIDASNRYGKVYVKIECSGFDRNYEYFNLQPYGFYNTSGSSYYFAVLKAGEAEGNDFHGKYRVDYSVKKIKASDLSGNKIKNAEIEEIDEDEFFAQMNRVRDPLKYPYGNISKQYKSVEALNEDYPDIMYNPMFDFLPGKIYADENVRKMRGRLDGFAYRFYCCENLSYSPQAGTVYTLTLTKKSKYTPESTVDEKNYNVFIKTDCPIEFNYDWEDTPDEDRDLTVKGDNYNFFHGKTTATVNLPTAKEKSKSGYIHRDGYVFQGFYDTFLNKKVKAITAETGDGTMLAAVWKPRIFTLKYKIVPPEKGVKVEGKIVKNQKVNYGEPDVYIRGGNLYAEGYVLKGWTTDKGSLIVRCVPDQFIKGDNTELFKDWDSSKRTMTLYPKWERSGSHIVLK